MNTIAIHDCPGTFSDQWIALSREKQIPHVIVNCFDNDIIQQLEDIQGLLWHFSHTRPIDLMIARSVIQATEQAGKRVFPSIRTCWHFDDKIAQKYLLETVHAPLVASHIFYSLEQCEKWLSRTSFPLVFKLRRGAGSANVRLVKSVDSAIGVAQKMFSKGIRPVPNFTGFVSNNLSSVVQSGLLRRKFNRIPVVAYHIWKTVRQWENEKGYAYFQEYLPGNNFDTRVTIIGGRAFAFIRYVRPNDFRASGSGNIDYDTEKINPKCVNIAFETASKIGAQSTAFDFALAENNEPKILEISYCYNAEAVFKCSGYWDPDLNWHPGHVWPQDAILEDLLNSL